MVTMYEASRPGTSLPSGQTSQYESSRPGVFRKSSSYKKVKKAREDALIQAAAEDRLSASQASELANAGITVSPNPRGEGVIVTRTTPEVAPSKPSLTPEQVNIARDALYGTKTTTSQISGAEAARIAREQQYPMSVRDDVPYTVTSVEQVRRTSSPKLQSIDPNAGKTPFGYAPTRIASGQETMNVETPSPKPKYDFSYINDSTPNLFFAPGESDRSVVNVSQMSFGEESRKAFRQGGVVGIGGGTALAGMSFVFGAGKGLLGTAEFFSPYSFQKGKWQIPVYTPASDLIESLPDIPKYAVSEPFEFAGSLAGMYFGGRMIKGFGESFKVRTTDFPQETGGGVVVLKQLGFETKTGKSFTFGSLKKDVVIESSLVDGVVKPNKINFKFDVFDKSPDVTRDILNLRMDSSISDTGGGGEGIRISNPIETKLIQNNLLRIDENLFVDVGRVKEFIPTGKKIIKTIGDEPSPFIRDLPKTTEFLNERETGIILMGAEETKSVVTGSYSRGGQLGEDFSYGGKPYKLTKVPKDIDTHLTGTVDDVFLAETTELRRLQDSGGRFRIPDFEKSVVNTPQGDVILPGVISNAIEKFDIKTGVWNKAHEILNENVVPEYTKVPDMILGFDKEGPRIKIGDNIVSSLSEENRGVLQGLGRLRRTPDGLIDIYPREGRLKDIGSFSVSSRSLYEGINYKNPIKGKRLLSNIERFESFYPEDAVKGQVEGVVADFSHATKPSGGGFVSPLSVFGLRTGVFDKSLFSPSARVSSKALRSPVSGKISQVSLSMSKSSFSPFSASKSLFSSPSPKSSSSSRSSSASSSPSMSSVYNSLYGSQSPSPSRSSSPSPSPSSSLYSSPSPSPNPSRNSSPSPYRSPSPSPSPSPYGSSYSPRSPSPISPFMSQSPSSKSNSKGNDLFKVYVRESKPKGKAKIKEYLVNKKPLSRNAAINLGARYTDETTSRTFRIVRAGKGNVIDEPLSFNYFKFRGRKGRSKLNPTSFVEKSKYAIDTPGEHQGITVKGLLANKRKNSMWRL